MPAGVSSRGIQTKLPIYIKGQGNKRDIGSLELFEDCTLLKILGQGNLQKGVISVA